MSQGDVNTPEEDLEHDVDSTYKPPPEKTIEEILATDQEDESLRKYKETLLGQAQVEKIVVGKRVRLRKFVKCFIKTCFF